MSASAPAPTTHALVIRLDPLLTTRAKTAGDARVGKGGCSLLRALPCSVRRTSAVLRIGPVQEHKTRRNVRKNPVQRITHVLRIAIKLPKHIQAKKDSEEH